MRTHLSSGLTIVVGACAICWRATLAQDQLPALARPVDSALPLRSSVQLAMASIGANTQVSRQPFDLPGRSLVTGEQIEVSLGAKELAADGESTMRMRILLRDAEGRPIVGAVKLALDTDLGRFRLPDGRLASSAQIVVQEGGEELELVASSVAGSAAVRVSSGPVNALGGVDFVAQERPLFGIGIADLTLSLDRSLHHDAVVAKTGFEDNFHNWDAPNQSGDVYQNMSSRAAGFLKGTIFSDYVLTSAYDSAKINQSKFFWDVNPNDYYPIYGDTSVVRYDARSTSKLFLRVDRQKNYLLYGDFLTAEPTRPLRLGSYSRTLTGARVHFDNGPVSGTGFAARTSRTTMVDEQPGLGLSGPYAVSQLNALANSEQITIVVRDRYQPAIVVSRTPKVRHVDYEFEPFSGRILFREPVPSADENLNPVSIRVVYEVEQGGPEHWVGGVEGRIEVADALALSGRYARDDNPLTQKTLAGATAEWAPREGTQMSLDIASSEGTDFIGGRALSARSLLNPQGGGLQAGAGALLDKPAGHAFRADLRHEDGALKAQGFVARADVGFDNASAGINAGHKEALLKSEYAVGERTALVASGRYSQDFIAEGTQAIVSAGVRHDITPKLRLSVGLNKVRDDYPGGVSPLGTFGASAVPGLAAPTRLNTNTFGSNEFQYSPFSNLLGSNCLRGAPCEELRKYTSVYADARYEITPQWIATGLAEQSVEGDHGWRVSVGSEYRFQQAGRVYGRYEWVDGLLTNYGFGDDLKRSHRLIFGADTAYMKGGNVFEELRLAQGREGRDAVNAIGVRNVFNLGESLVATTSVENQVLLTTESGRRNAKAVAGGLEYTTSPLWRVGGRLEYRISDTQKTWLSSASAVRRLNEDWSLLARNLLLKSEGRDTAQGQNQLQDRFQVGIAYRDTGSNKLNVIGRYEHNVDRNTGPLAPTNYRNDVVALSANFRPSRPLTASVSTAFKRQVDRFDGPASVFEGKLVSGRLMYDINDRWDIGVLASDSWGGPTRDRGVGLEVGYRAMNNLWLSTGYVAGSFADSELYSTNSRWSKAYVRMRFKFDENVFKP
ncbi:hypothetical protein [Xylophilus sp. GOD-11R]|uniref:hypothetical protein n=1 Tax=Xylophilus sp. GOD-11R TaxID=3089814 RepID=UPI00298C5EFD|nr:hypothetical protein [Xylophilus sp. GOD-11R]WPB56145.1 hypothetical protein R9X41_18650 [Xylophilus sp. GOD-11R]